MPVLRADPTTDHSPDEARSLETPASMAVLSSQVTADFEGSSPSGGGGLELRHERFRLGEGEWGSST
jgi:hypothetical protein